MTFEDFKKLREINEEIDRLNILQERIDNDFNKCKKIQNEISKLKTIKEKILFKAKMHNFLKEEMRKKTRWLKIF